MADEPRKRISTQLYSKPQKPNNKQVGAGTGREILEILESGLVLTPVVIANNLGRNRDMVNRKLLELVDCDVVDRVARGKYRLNFEEYELGTRYFGKKDTSELYTLQNYENEIYLEEIGMSLHGYLGEVEREATRIYLSTEWNEYQSMQRAEKNLRICLNRADSASRWRDETQED